MVVEMKILVTGSRTWMDANFVHEVLNDLYAAEPFTLVCGYDPRTRQPKGVDQFSYEWSLTRFTPEAECWPAWWEVYGKPAGFIRNQNMVSNAKPDLCVAFIHDGSPGATDCVTRAWEAEIPFRIYTEGNRGGPGRDAHAEDMLRTWRWPHARDLSSLLAQADYQA
jgi:hypothetical protein